MRGNASVDDGTAKTKDYLKKRRGEGERRPATGRRIDSDESAVVVEVSFASDALVSLEDKE